MKLWNLGLGLIAIAGGIGTTASNYASEIHQNKAADKNTKIKIIPNHVPMAVGWKTNTEFNYWYGKDKEYVHKDVKNPGWDWSTVHYNSNEAIQFNFNLDDGNDIDLVMVDNGTNSTFDVPQYSLYFNVHASSKSISWNDEAWSVIGLLGDGSVGFEPTHFDVNFTLSAIKSNQITAQNIYSLNVAGLTSRGWVNFNIAA